MVIAFVVSTVFWTHMPNPTPVDVMSTVCPAPAVLLIASAR
jgi:hypothetical protein